MRTIYKYALSLTDGEQFIDMPQGSVFLKAGEQHGRLVFWVDSRTTNEMNPRAFKVVGTGQEIGEYAYEYKDTVKMSNGLVWHIYEA